MGALLAMLIAGVVLATSQAEKRAKAPGGGVQAPGGTRPKGEIPLAELVEAAMNEPREIRHDLAALLEAAGERELAKKLLQGLSTPAAGDDPDAQKRAMVAALIEAWTEAGADDLACLSLPTQLILNVQNALGVDATGVYDIETAFEAQEIDAAAPATCLGIVPGPAPLPGDPNVWTP